MTNRGAQPLIHMLEEHTMDITVIGTGITDGRGRCDPSVGTERGAVLPSVIPWVAGPARAPALG